MLEIENLKTNFNTYDGVVKALDGVNLKIEDGEIFGLVGETGSGKSVTCYSALKLLPKAGEVVDGSIKLNGEDITIYGKGDQTRSFCYVEDTLSGIIKAMDSESSEVFNIGNPNEISVKKLAEIIIKLTNSNSSLKFLELPEDDPMQRKPDISKAEEFLNWSPKIPLEEGLLKTIDWVKSSIN